jgi:hypothetical protein
MFVYFDLFTGFLNVQPMVGPNMDAAKIRQVVKPLFDQLNQENIPHDMFVKEFPTFFELYLDMFSDEGAGLNMVTGGRLFTKKDISANADGIVDAIRQSVEVGQAGIIGHIVGPGYGAPVVDNAIHPRWRDGSSFVITAHNRPLDDTWEEKRAAERFVTDVIDAPLRAASPYGAAYVNEGNLAEPNWQTAYWGSNYPRLLRLKKIWDPLGVFYARTTPGTEDWEVIDYGTRLCRKL